MTHYLYMWRTYDAFPKCPTHMALYLLLFHLERSSFHQNVQKHKLYYAGMIIADLTHYLYTWRTYDAFSTPPRRIWLFMSLFHLERSSFHQNYQKHKLYYAGMIIVDLTLFIYVTHMWRIFDTIPPTHLYLLLCHLERSSFHQYVQKQ